MSKIPSLHFQIEIWAIVFSISALINFKIVYIWPIWPKVWTRRFGLQFFCFVFFSSTRELHSAWDFEYWKFLFFVKLWLILSQLELPRTEVQKCSHSVKRCISALSFFIPHSWYHPLSLETCNPPTSSWHHPLRGNTRFYNDTLE